MSQMTAVTNEKPVIDNDIKSTDNPRKLRIVYRNVILFLFMHIGSVYGIYLLVTKAKWQTWLFTYFLYKISLLGITAGAHRLWSHRAYKAKLPLQIILLTFYTMAFMGSVFIFAREHRVHHKYSDTDADPHNSSRGFFFSHIGWLMVKKHPDVAAKGREIDLSDITSDKLLNFHRKYFMLFVLVICFIIPTYIPVLWHEDKWTAFFVAVILRYTFSLHAIFLANSGAHKWGNKPYDKGLKATESKFISIFASGEAFHNYHHAFPWDYKAAEMGGYAFNTARLFIDLMAKIGWAYDLRTASQEMIEARAKRTGDHTHPACQKASDQ